MYEITSNEASFLWIVPSKLYLRMKNPTSENAGIRWMWGTKSKVWNSIRHSIPSPSQTSTLVPTMPICTSRVLARKWEKVQSCKRRVKMIIWKKVRNRVACARKFTFMKGSRKVKIITLGWWASPQIWERIRSLGWQEWVWHNQGLTSKVKGWETKRREVLYDKWAPHEFSGSNDLLEGSLACHHVVVMPH